MYIIDKATQALVALLVLLVAAFLGAAAWYAWSRKKRKGKSPSGAGVDYGKLERRNALDYVKLDDIRDGMILAEGGTRFIAAIRCQGFDFYYAHVAEQYAAQAGYRGFLNTVTRPITYRQYTKAVDLEHTRQNYAGAHAALQDMLFNLSEDYKAAERQAQGGAQADAGETEGLQARLTGMQRAMAALEWRLLHVEDQIAYLGQLGERSGTPVSLETYVVDWVYSPMDYPVELKADEIMKKAEEELGQIVRQKINALSTAGVKAYRCTTDELVDMVRRHFQPISADKYKVKDIRGSSYFSDIASMEGKGDLKAEYDRELSMEIIKAASSGLSGPGGQEGRKGWEQ